MPRIGVVLFALLVSFPAYAQKSLHWKALEVEARLDAEGRLHVRERHVMVFTGDWNGGERVFEPGRDGRLDFNSITREGVGRLKRGNLDRIDHYDFTDKSTLRWRSRYQSDPPFDNTEIAYVLDYSLENILLTKGDEYFLDHDFAFPNRTGDIERFTLRLELDPVWRPAVRVDTPIAIDRGPLRPGEGVDVDLPLTFHGSSAPSGVRIAAATPLRLAALGALFAASVFFFLRFDREQKERGRFAPLTPISQIDEAWLKEHVFSMKPEVVGAAWDESTGAAEVAALIARMTQEKKLETRVRPASGFFASDMLELELKVDRGTLTGYEKKLVQVLFGSSDHTDTESIKKRYRSSGFDPSSHIDDGVDESLERLRAWRDQPGESRKRGSLLSLVASLALLAFAAVGGETDLLAVVTTFFGSTVACLAAAAVAAITSRAVVRVRSSLVATLVLIAAIAIAPVKWLTDFASPIGTATAIALAVFAATLVRLAFEAGRTRQSPEKIALRKRLASARLYFKEQLRLKSPSLDDAWFPYVLAFGLGREIDRWFRRFGGESEVAATSHTMSSSSTSGGSSRAQWTGGGGSFGGAGASGSWALAVGAVASGVAAPSSSGSSGGGSSSGGGGSSSGGGGGGGW